MGDLINPTPVVHERRELRKRVRMRIELSSNDFDMERMIGTGCLPGRDCALASPRRRLL